MFTEQALKHFRNPKHVGELKNFDAHAKAGDPGCSDIVEIWVRFEEDKIKDAKFKVFGCPGAISTTDCFIDLVKGKTIEYALNITEEGISDALGGLPTAFMHCSDLSIEAFKRCVDQYDYRNNRR